VDEDLSTRVRVISHSSLHCCPAHVWEPYTRGALRAWMEDAASPPVVALHWDPATGRVARVSNADDTFLRDMARWLADTPGVPALDTGIARITDEFVPARASALAPGSAR
jgi:hypothetical protein